MLPTANRRLHKVMVNIPHHSSRMVVINNLLLVNIPLSKAGISNLTATILPPEVLPNLSNLMVDTNSNLLLHNSTAHLQDLHRAIMARLLLTSNIINPTANLHLRRPVSTARLLLNNMERRQSNRLHRRLATDRLRSSNGMAAPTLTLCAKQ